MGATTWQYFVPYQEDATQALESLQAEVFRSGAYQKPFALRESGVEPESLDQVLQAMDEEGTGSILDIYQVSESPESGSVFPLPTEEIVEIFGTLTPDRDKLIEAAESGAYEDYVSRGEGIYLPAFNKEGTPLELFFWGYSGD